MKVENLRSLIRESINEYIREIDNAGNKAALEAKMTATQEAIDLRKKKMNMEGLDEAYHDMLDKGKVKELSGEVKALEKSLTKLKKQLDKLNSKSEPKKEVVKDEPVEEGDAMDGMENAIVPEIELEEAHSKKGKAVKKDEEVLNESFIKMQKLAGVITESQYNQKIKLLNEEVKLPQVGDEFSYPEEEDKIQITKVDNQYVYARSKTKDNKNYTIGLTSWEDKITKGKLLNEEVTVGGTYTASMPTSSDGKERIDVKVKVLGKDRSNEDKFIVTPLEDKDYTNAASGQQNRFEKGKQYGVEAEFIK